PDAAAALLDLLDDLVAVHRPLGEQRQDGRADVAAPGAATAVPAAPPEPGAGAEAAAGTEVPEGGAVAARLEARRPRRGRRERRAAVVVPVGTPSRPAMSGGVHRCTPFL